MCNDCNELERLCAVCWELHRREFEAENGGEQAILDAIHQRRWESEHAEEIDNITREC